jgi:hypothetical protein
MSNDNMSVMTVMTVMTVMSVMSVMSVISVMKKELFNYHHIYRESYDGKTVKIAKIQQTTQLISHNSVNNDRK